MGRWYICQECGEKFENPEFDLKCQKCCKTFVIKEAQVTDVPKFSLNLTRKKEIRQNVASLENIKKLLTELNFNIQIPGLIVGEKSGMTHHFSLIAKKQVNDQEINIALDHSVSETEIQPSPVILYLYKTSEVNVDIPIFVAVPKLSETTQKIAQGHNILIIEGSTDAPEVLNRIKKEIEDRISQVTQNKSAIEKPVEELKEKPVTTFFGKFLGSKKKQLP
jgi:DNA-directed RNA polymerase subunit RPC12/RpoP